jgi:hypothetical protein
MELGALGFWILTHGRDLEKACLQENLLGSSSIIVPLGAGFYFGSPHPLGYSNIGPLAHAEHLGWHNLEKHRFLALDDIFFKTKWKNRSTATTT